jgi:hypothetical protein
VTVAVHESAHVAVALALGRKVDYVRRQGGNLWHDEELGAAGIPLDGGRFQASDLIVRLAGYAAERRWANWPPDYAKACREDLEDLDIIIDALDLTAEQYGQLVQRTEDLLNDPDVSRLQAAIARALTRVPRLEREDIEALRQAHGFPMPTREQEPAPCST